MKQWYVLYVYILLWETSIWQSCHAIIRVTTFCIQHVYGKHVSRDNHFATCMNIWQLLSVMENRCTHIFLLNRVERYLDRLPIVTPIFQWQFHRGRSYVPASLFHVLWLCLAPAICRKIYPVISTYTIWSTKSTQRAKLRGPTWAPCGSCRPQMGPMWASWTLLSG